MTDEVQKLEREVEIARARLKSDLSILSSPDTYASFKEDLKGEASSTFHNLLEGLKARAAANPAAALAIGAGVAWRFIERPPIAAALIGAGLFSLFRTSPRDGLPFRKRDYLTEGRERLGEQVSELANEIRDGAVGAATVATARVSAAAREAQNLASTAAFAAREHVLTGANRSSEAMTRASEWIEEVPARAGRVFQKTSLAIEDAVSDDDTRNKILMGVAGVAVAAALSIAFQRSLTAD